MKCLLLVSPGAESDVAQDESAKEKRQSLFKWDYLSPAVFRKKQRFTNITKSYYSLRLHLVSVLHYKTIRFQRSGLCLMIIIRRRISIFRCYLKVCVT